MEQTIQSWLLYTLSQVDLAQVLGLSTASSIWSKHEHSFAPRTHSGVMQLCFELQTIRRGSLSMSDYLDKIKNLSDRLAAGGHALTEKELVFYTLGGLGPEFE